jgi:hypothetical protein
VAEFYRTAPHTLASFVSNHDQFAGRRLWDQVAGDEGAYRLAAATYLLLPGTPFIYYGEEIGMAGARGLSGDPAIRGPYSWTGEPERAGFSTARPYRALAANQATHTCRPSCGTRPRSGTFIKTCCICATAACRSPVGAMNGRRPRASAWPSSAGMATSTPW